MYTFIIKASLFFSTWTTVVQLLEYFYDYKKAFFCASIKGCGIFLVLTPKIFLLHHFAICDTLPYHQFLLPYNWI